MALQDKVSLRNNECAECKIFADKQTGKIREITLLVTYQKLRKLAAISEWELS